MHAATTMRSAEKSTTAMASSSGGTAGPRYTARPAGDLEEVGDHADADFVLVAGDGCRDDDAPVAGRALEERVELGQHHLRGGGGEVLLGDVDLIELPHAAQFHHGRGEDVEVEVGHGDAVGSGGGDELAGPLAVALEDGEQVLRREAAVGRAGVEAWCVAAAAAVGVDRGEGWGEVILDQGAVFFGDFGEEGFAEDGEAEREIVERYAAVLKREPRPGDLAGEEFRAAGGHRRGEFVGPAGKAVFPLAGGERFEPGGDGGVALDQAFCGAQADVGGCGAEQFCDELVLRLAILLVRFLRLFHVATSHPYLIFQPQPGHYPPWTLWDECPTRAYPLRQRLRRE